MRDLALGMVPGEGDFDRERRLIGDRISELGRKPYAIVTRQDFEQLYGAISYLRLLEGEKHILLVSEEGLLPGGTLMRLVASMAADARVTISPIHTGGVPLSWEPQNLRMEGREPPRLVGRSPNQVWAMAASQSLAKQTGGAAALYQDGRLALERWNRSTSFTYLLGYYPSGGQWDGSVRRIEVRVRRKDVSVLSRGMYFAQPGVEGYDSRRVLSYARLSTAGASSQPVADIPVTISVNTSASRTEPIVKVTLAIDANAVEFKTVGDRFRASLDFAIFAGDARESLVGERWGRLDLDLGAADYEGVRQDGIRHSIELPVSGRVRHLKAVVYEYSTDLVGSATTTLR